MIKSKEPMRAINFTCKKRGDAVEKKEIAVTGLSEIMNERGCDGGDR